MEQAIGGISLVPATEKTVEDDEDEDEKDSEMTLSRYRHEYVFSVCLNRPRRRPSSSPDFRRGRAKLPASFLRSCLFPPGKPPRSPTEDADDWDSR
jgi:hypothetical protein